MGHLVGRCRGARLVAGTLALTTLLPGCLSFGRRGEDPPDALTRYLDALVARDYPAAYGLTLLEQIASSVGPGAALSLPHFEAFHRANPLRGYEIEKVTNIDRRTLDAPNEEGTPYFVVDVRLSLPEGKRVETLSVQGEVLGRVEVDPDPVLVRAPGPAVRSMVVDGVVTPVRPQPGDTSARTYSLLLFRGRHRLSVAGLEFGLATEPLAVTDGAARIEEGPPRAVRIEGQGGADRGIGGAQAPTTFTPSA